MPIEIILMIYENLDLKSLINVVKSHPNHQNVASTVVKNELGIKLVEFKDFGYYGKYYGQHSAGSSRFLTDILTFFGHLIEIINVDYAYLYAFSIEQLNQIIDDSNLQSLKQIELKNCTENIFKSLPNAFKRAKGVRLIGTVNSDEINLKELFPEVRKLDINNLQGITPANIEHHFPHLQNMHVEGDATMDSPSFVQRIRLNPQLRILDISSFSWQGLKQISELLPNLEKLTVFYFEGEVQFDGNIHFPNLKYLYLRELPRNIARIPITCTTLEELYTNYVDLWFDVVIQNKNLRKISCGELTDGQFQRIGDELSNLTELHTYYQLSNADIVLKFVEASKNLQRIRFKRPNRRIIDEINKTLKRDWFLTQVVGDGNGLCFHRLR